MECTDVCKCRGLFENIVYVSAKSDSEVEQDIGNDNAC